MPTCPHAHILAYSQLTFPSLLTALPYTQTIHPAIAHALRMHCILPLPRVGRAGVAAVASATGATPIASIEDVLPGHTPAGQVQPGEGKPARVSSSSSARHEEGTPYLQGASARADVQLVQVR